MSGAGPLPAPRDRRRPYGRARANRRERFAPMKKPGRADDAAIPGLEYLRPRALSVHHCLEALQRHHADLLAGRLCLEHHLLAGEGVDSLTGLRRGLLHDLHLQQAGHGEETVALQALLDHAVERVEDAADLLARQPRVFGDLSQDFRLGRSTTLFRHIAPLLEYLMIVSALGCSRAMCFGAENSTCAHLRNSFFRSDER